MSDSEYDTGTAPFEPAPTSRRDAGRGGPLSAPWSGVRRIAVLRGGGLGDLLFALPAVDALAAAYPDAEIDLLGTASHAELLSGRPGPVHEVIALPPAGDDRSGDAEFFRRVGRTPIDLGVQVHGGGRWSNGFLRQLRPRWTVGSRTPDAPPLTRMLPFRHYQHETLRALEVVGLAGARPMRLEPALEVTDTDLALADAALTRLPKPVVALHPGATDPRRWWPIDRFARVAAHCLRQGLGVVAVGTNDERELLAQLVSHVEELAPQPYREGALMILAGADMTTLCGVLARSCLLVGNDSGPRHLAAALGTPTVAVYWLGNVINAAPLGRARDRVLMSWTTRCPVCGRDCTDESVPRCAHDVSFVDGVSVEQVLAEVDELLG
ncbi:glycosyltransferase family 9 protein [Nocardia sp. BMG51109]|uniref:glycosyltransferase family 9 protein n=1 Tax=Nocardia sp. BMG51109 TaxID=1056816 RepID=UPI0004AE8737|nr:glycosyltransferase family 9 protein [Nocardia sp. BMG51109]